MLDPEDLTDAFRGPRPRLAQGITSGIWGSAEEAEEEESETESEPHKASEPDGYARSERSYHDT